MSRNKKPKQLAVVHAEPPHVKVTKRIEVPGLHLSVRSLSIVYEGSAEGAVEVLRSLNAALGVRRALDPRTP